MDIFLLQALLTLLQTLVLFPTPLQYILLPRVRISMIRRNGINHFVDCTLDFLFPLLNRVVLRFLRLLDVFKSIR
jgi:hypothetical protein